ncbi:cystathionine beta-lyase [Tribonema minus]|uniref:cysteine-S-conjugate beta-lyase n=1 Tax=Tribonema minus TaxID=303371 RepID=A0A836C8G0_9STRA|nr:cystathionine beta-lyase [Tribonema minus]
MEKLNEGDVLELVLEYLNTKGFTQAEQALRKEQHIAATGRQGTGTCTFERCSRSRLEGLLEKSHVAHMFGSSVANKRRRTNLDAALAAEPSASEGDNKDASLTAAPEESPMTMATQITSYNPCKDDPYGASSMPIYQVSTFAQPSATTFGEYDYSRSGNPTRAALEKQICELEGGHRGFAFSSGMAALSAVTRLVKPGQEIILNDDSYGGTYRLLSKVAARNHVIVRYVDMSGSQGPAKLKSAISDNTRLIMLESPTNPMQRILDIRAISAIAHAHNAIVELGADIVVHSATKFISGHSDCMAGVVVVKDRALAEQVYFFQNAEGTGLSPFDSWLLLRGVKTMHIRVERQQENALAVAAFLSAHPRISHVYYTGLPSHPGHGLHMSQASGGGSVICFRTGSLPFSQHIVTHTKLFKITVSFGSVNSLISLPGAMSHASIPAEVRAAREFPEDLIRISVGIESAQDLIADLSRAMASYAASAAAAAAIKPAAAADGSSGGGGSAEA